MGGILVPLLIGLFLLKLAPKLSQLANKKKKKKYELYIQIAGMAFLLIGVISLVRFIF